MDGGGRKGQALKDDLRRKQPHTGFVPTPMELCRPILMVLRKERMDHESLRKAVAHHLDFPFKAIRTKFETEGGASFVNSFHLAMQHLHKSKLIEQSGKTLIAVLDPNGRTGAVPPMGEFQLRPAPEHSLKWPVDIDKLRAELPTFSFERLLQYFEASTQFSSSVKGKKLGRQINALAVGLHVHEEFIRRGIIAEDGSFIHWPSTEAPGGDGSLTLGELPKIGPLKALGYEVGKDAQGPAQRCRLLTRAFLEDLPLVQGVEEWGENDSSQRLRKIAESIAAFARNAKRRKSGSWADAALRWEHDLEYLRVTHYVGRFDNRWRFPSTTV